MPYSNQVQALIDEAPLPIQERIRVLETYNSACDAARKAKNAESERLLNEKNSEKTDLANLQRAIERNGKPFRVGTDRDGAPTKIEYDPTEPVKARIASISRAHNKLQDTPVPTGIAFEKFLASLHGQQLVEAEPIKLTIRKNETLAEAFDRATAATDAAIKEHARIQRAKLPVSEALENARDYVERMQAPGPSVYALFAGGRWLRSGKFSPENPRPEPDFEKHYVPMPDGADPFPIVDPVKLFAAIAPDLLLGALERQIIASGNDDRSIPSGEKPQRLAEAAQAIVAAQRLEFEVGLEAVRQRVPIMLRKAHPSVAIGAEWPVAQIVDYLDHK